MTEDRVPTTERRRVLSLMRVNPDWEGLGERTPEQYAEEVLDAYAAAIRAEQPAPPLDVGRVYAAIDNHARYHRRTNPAHHNRECDGWIASEYARLGSAPSTEGRLTVRTDREHDPRCASTRARDCDCRDRAVGAPPPPIPPGQPDLPHSECVTAYHRELLLTGRTIMSVARVRADVAASEQAAPPLDVERLARAIHASGDPHDPVSIAAEYTRLGSAPSTEEKGDD